ncbi:MAG: hypothetical protein ACRCTE_10350 [Cellulosilyticaceae bacterium]
MKSLENYRKVAVGAWSGAIIGWLVVPFNQVIGMCMVYIALIVGIMMEMKYKCPECKVLLDSKGNHQELCPKCGSHSIYQDIL